VVTKRRYMRSGKIAPHIHYLRDVKHMSDLSIAQTAGVPKWVVQDVRAGRKPFVYASYGRAILKVQDGPARYLLSPLEAMRQLQALAVMDWSLETIASMDGTPDNSELSNIRRGAVKVGVTARVLEAINTFYEAHKHEHGPNVVAGNRARLKGWHGPEYWEEHDITAPEEVATAA
jgi:hypothetical protein